MKKLLSFLALFFTLSAVTSAQQIETHANFGYAPPETDNGEILVDFENDEPDSAIVSFFRQSGLLETDYSWISGEENWLRVARSVSSSIIEKIRKNRDIEAIEPNYYYSALYTPNDPYYKHQWHLDLIGMKEAWDFPKGAPVTVAVIDTGVAYEDFRERFLVEDLSAGQFVDPYNFLTGDSHANDDHGHGTHVAGTIAQLTNNGVGVAGVAPQVRIMPLKVLNSRGYGTLSGIAAAIRYAADHGAKVINMSLGGPFPSFILHKAIRYAADKGVIIVCAAGNSGRSGIGYPARYKECISVSAVRYDGRLSWYSSYGKGLTIAAPGGDMNVDQNGDGLLDGVLQNTLNPQDPSKQGYFLFQGTSMAAPHVAAVAALLISHGVSDRDAVLRYLQDTAKMPESGAEEHYGAGIVNADAALSKIFLRRNLYLFSFGFVILFLLLSGINRKRGKTEKASFGFLPLLGLLLGSTGLFFFWKFGVIGDSFLVTHSVVQWPAIVAGARYFSNPLLYSALPVYVVLFALYPWQRLATFTIGFAAGCAAFLLYHAIFPVNAIDWLPGQLMETAWCASHSLLSLVAALLASFRLK